MITQHEKTIREIVTIDAEIIDVRLENWLLDELYEAAPELLEEHPEILSHPVFVNVILPEKKFEAWAEYAQLN
jgi:hypothetical protein